MPARAISSGGWLVSSRSPTSTEPDEMCTIPTRLLSSVLLPDPLGPTRATTCPGLALTGMPRITGSPPYPAVTFRADSGRPCRGLSADKVALHHLAPSTQPL